MANRINRCENKLRRKVMLQPRAPQSSDVLWGALGHSEEKTPTICYVRIELNTNVILVDKGNYSATQQRYSI